MKKSINSDNTTESTAYNTNETCAAQNCESSEVQKEIAIAEPKDSLPQAQFPDELSRPCYFVIDDRVEHKGCQIRPGVYFCTVARSKKGEFVLIETWICSPLYIEAVTCDNRNNNFGRLLRYKPTIGNWRQWAMPMELHRGSCDELRGELLAMGVEFDPISARKQLSNYLNQDPPNRKILCATQVGWCGESFVLPDVVIGPTAENIIFQSGERVHDEHTRAGTLDEWKAEIASLAIGNPLLILALSGSFVGPLLARCKAESGGIHIYGDSSCGKSTLLSAASSIWGGPNFKRSWKATANGLEGAAIMSNDGLLALDEISQCDPRQVGEIVYTLGNGTGKQRAGITGNAKPVAFWRCFVLSNGEFTIDTTMKEGGHRVKAGQSMRLLNIPASQPYGAFNDLHGAKNGSEFADHLKLSAEKYYGHAGRAFLERLTRDKTDYCDKLQQFKSLPMFLTNEIGGQKYRAAGRFALIGLAGELATEYGLTGWYEGAAIEAASLCFNLWKGNRSKGNDERHQILDQVSIFIEKNGDGRFSSADEDSEKLPFRDRAGWWEDSHEGRIYLFTSSGLREATEGFEFKRALDILEDASVIPPKLNNGERAKLKRIGGRSIKLYYVNSEKLLEGLQNGD